MAFSVRLGEWYFPKSDLKLVLAIFSAPAVAVPIFIYFGLYRYKPITIGSLNFVLVQLNQTNEDPSIPTFSCLSFGW
jgi:hypothetical protein